MGLTSLGNNLYVVRRKAADVEVYDIQSLTLISLIPVKRLLDASDMESCRRNSYLFVADAKLQHVFKIDLRRMSDVNGWPTRGSPSRLSVTSKTNVIVSFVDLALLREYSGNGRLIREIVVDAETPSAVRLFHAIQVNGYFMIGQGGARPKVFLMRESGFRVLSANDPPESDVGAAADVPQKSIDYPTHLAVDASQCVLVADQYNGRVLVLSPSLANMRELIASDRGVKQPFRLRLDQRSGLLFVSDFLDGRVSVFKVVCDSGIVRRYRMSLIYILLCFLYLLCIAVVSCIARIGQCIIVLDDCDV